jgi:hypothetical protein
MFWVLFIRLAGFDGYSASRVFHPIGGYLSVIIQPHSVNPHIQRYVNA